MYFEVGVAIPCYGRSDADIGDAGPGLAIDLDAGQINPGQRSATTLELDIGGRGAQLARQFLTVQNPAFNGEGAPQQPFGKAEISAGQGVSYLGTADSYAIELNGLRRFDRKFLHQPCLLQEVEVAHPVTAKAEIVADFQMLYAQAVHQNGVDKFGGAELAQALIERQAQDPINSGVCQQLQLVTQACQTGRSRFRGKELARLRLENHHAADWR